VTCSTELCTGTSECTLILIQEESLVDLRRWNISKCATAVVRLGALFKMNEFVSVQVVPTRSARVIADEVAHSNRMLIRDQKMNRWGRRLRLCACNEQQRVVATRWRRTHE
jgi:hypothetical protein